MRGPGLRLFAVESHAFHHSQFEPGCRPAIEMHVMRSIFQESSS
jgi:hypothetical protein